MRKEQSQKIISFFMIIGIIIFIGLMLDSFIFKVINENMRIALMLLAWMPAIPGIIQFFNRHQKKRSRRS